LQNSSYGSSRLKLLPLHPFVGLEATNAISTATIAQHTALQNKQEKQVLVNILQQCFEYSNKPIEGTPTGQQKQLVPQLL